MIVNYLYHFNDDERTWKKDDKKDEKQRDSYNFKYYNEINRNRFEKNASKTLKEKRTRWKKIHNRSTTLKLFHPSTHSIFLHDNKTREKNIKNDRKREISNKEIYKLYLNKYHEKKSKNDSLDQIKKEKAFMKNNFLRNFEFCPTYSHYHIHSTTFQLHAVCFLFLLLTLRCISQY